MNITVGLLADWILLHRTGKAFCSYTKDTIVHQLNTCLDSGTVFFASDGNNIQGVVCGTLDNERKVVNVDDILAVKPGVLVMFVRRFRELFPGYVITGTNNNGKQITYNTDRLLDKILSKEKVKE